MARNEANPTPELLVWARNTAGHTIETASKKLGISAERLQAWESGAEKPTFAQLRHLGMTYKRPIAVFYLSEPPTTFEAIRDFRRTGEGDAPPSPSLYLEIRKAQDRHSWALELLDDLDEGIPELRVPAVSDSAEPDLAAGQIRTALGVSVAQQRAWRTPYDSLSNWRRAVEGAGILTFQATDLPLTEARGFSLAVRPLPVVVANIKDAPRGRLFTFLHELVHVCIRQTGVCDLHEAGRRPPDVIESFCNRVSGALLFPRAEFLGSDVVRRHGLRNPEWTDEELGGLSRDFGGSREAALVRLLTLGLTTRQYYQSKREEFLEQYRQAQKLAKGFAPPHVVALASAGPAFTGIVVESFNREKITASDVADFLQVRLKHLADIQRDYSIAV